MLKIKWLNNSSFITVFELYFSFKRIRSGESSHSPKGDHQQQRPKNKTKQNKNTYNVSLIYGKAMHSYTNLRFNKGYIQSRQEEIM